MARIEEDGNVYASFDVESAILKEIGEQLVGSSETALTELVKNSYDADASFANLEWNDSSIVIEDDGHGMTENEFLKLWMTVGTSNKIKNSKSRIYKRDISGSKGVGRFAVRFLGDMLDFESVAEVDGVRTKIEAVFDWNKIDIQPDLDKVKIKYEIQTGVDDPLGTRLSISKLKNTDDFSHSVDRVKTNLLGLESPLEPIINDLNIELVKKIESDPGFNFFDKKDELNEVQTNSTASEVLKSYVARAEVRYNAAKGELLVIPYHKDKENLKPFKKIVFKEKNLKSDFVADIRFLPRRKDVFNNLDGINGTAAYTWVRNHCGIGVYDRGFRLPPYGNNNNDWLFQDSDQAVSEREWRSEIMEKYFPMPEEIKTAPKTNYMLNLAKTTQVVGAVFVTSDRDRNSEGLTANMDRQGFKSNKAYLQLVEVVRFALEFIAMLDKQNLLEKEEEENRIILEDTRQDILEAISLINSSESLTATDKAMLVDQYQYLSKNIDSVEEYDRESRQALETMSLMGVIAGFMTHEYQSAIDHLEQASDLLGELSKTDNRFQKYKSGIDKNMTYFVDYIEYTRAFVTSLKSKKQERFTVLPRVELVADTFKGYCDDHSIFVDTTSIDGKLDAPDVPLALYQGIIHNLFANSIKAVISHKAEKRNIKIIAWNEGLGDRKKHILQIMDDGPGIPAPLKERIWDPMFTTTSNENNPLGSGMGLGLSLLKKVVKQHKGVIELKESPEGFSTCFFVELPFEKK